MSIRSAGLLLALTPILFLLAAQPAITSALRAQLAQSEQLVTQGKYWRLGEPASMIGRQPVGQAQWAQSVSGLTVYTLDSDVYVPLNFDGLLLPARALSQLTLSYKTQKTARVRFYHRATLGGPAARSDTLELKPDRQQMLVDMDGLGWSIEAKPVAWGQDDGTIATLRLHPIGADTQVELNQVSLTPAGVGSQDKGPSPPLDRAGWTPISDQTFWWSTAQVRRTLERIRHNPLSWQRFPSPATSAPTHHWVAMTILLGLLIVSGLRRRSTLVLLVISVWWCFSQPIWDMAYLTYAAMTLLLCIFVSSTGTQNTAELTDDGVKMVGRPVAAKSHALIEFFLLLALLCALFTAMLLLDGQSQSWWFAPRRWLIYLVWAALQQWVVCKVIYPLARRDGASRTLSVIVSAFIFGWAHLPNLELMILTWLLGLACLWHYSRHQTLWAPVVLHMVAGSALLAVNPLPFLYSVSAGPGYWG
ncbi:MAG: lysostaphin resistance A-like protein [Lysobacterales bacterium]